MNAYDVYPVGERLHHVVGPFVVEHEIATANTIHARHVSGPKTGFAETLHVAVTPLRPGLFLLAWQEKDGATVVGVEDFDAGTVHVALTTPDGQFMQLQGLLSVIG